MESQGDACPHHWGSTKWANGFQLHLCLEFCQESLLCTSICLLPDWQIFAAMYPRVYRPLPSMPGQPCHVHGAVRDVYPAHSFEQSSAPIWLWWFLPPRNQRCRPVMAGWARVSWSWGKTAALDNLWSCGPFPLLAALPVCFHRVQLKPSETTAHGNTHAHTEKLTGPFLDCDQQTQASSGMSSQSHGYGEW